MLDLCKDAGLNFTIPIHYHGDILCLRDECLHAGYGIGAVQKLIELDVDMDKAVVRGQTPAYIIASREKYNDAKDETYFEKSRGFCPENPWSRSPIPGRLLSTWLPTRAIWAC